MPELPPEMPAEQMPADVVALIGEPGEPLDAVIARIEARFQAYMESRWIAGDGDREAHRERLLELGERVDASMVEVYERWIDRGAGSYGVSPSALWGDSFADREPGWRDKEEDWENQRRITREWLDLARESGLLDEVMDVASYRLAVQKVIDPDRSESDYRQMDFNISVRWCLRLLWAEAVDRLEGGDTDRVIDAVDAMIALSDVSASQGIIIDNLIALSSLVVMCDSLLIAADRGVLDAELAAQLLTRMPSPDWRTMRSDYANDIYEDLYTNGYNMLRHYYRSDGRLSAGIAMASLVSEVERALLRFPVLRNKGDRHASAGEFAAAVEAWMAVAAEEYVKPTREQDLSRLEFPRRHEGAILPRLQERSQMYFLALDTHKRMVGATELALAIEVYRGRHGAPPARLQDLTPGVIERLPEDPFAPDGWFRYRPDADSRIGYILYSVGDNGEDFGGVRDTAVEYATPRNITPGTDYVILPRR
ncbi:MAG: hypothetical protein JJU33_12025 [Phycisphaerales bacterium]|nr:hypothetical protein [Phycisphaerales bacterium]